MTPVRIRNTVIGEGVPKICVPMTGATEEELLAEARHIAALPADMAEWRVDWYEHAFDTDAVLRTAEKIRAVLTEKVLLFTFRTAAEGGERAISPEDYCRLNLAAAQSGAVDLIDTELFMGEKALTPVIRGAHEAGVRVVASNHDFTATPPKNVLIQRLCDMQQLGADIVKIAVMPQDQKDVLTLLAATEEMNRLHAACPVITMSMAGLGAISRISGELFGSAVTFASAGKASAPGQLPIDELKTTLELFHGILH